MEASWGSILQSMGHRMSLQPGPMAGGFVQAQEAVAFSPPQVSWMGRAVLGELGGSQEAGGSQSGIASFAFENMFKALALLKARQVLTADCYLS